MSYQIDVLRDGNGNIIRPATVSDNVVVPSSGKSVSAELETIKGSMPNVEEQGFSIVDPEGNIGMKYDGDGLDAAKVSDHFLELVKGTGSSFDEVLEDGIFITDMDLNIGFYVDTSGIHAKNMIPIEIIND